MSDFSLPPRLGSERHARGVRLIRARDLEHWPYRCMRVLILSVLMVAAMGAPARAHAGLVEAEPSSGTGMPQAPPAVVLRFTEPLVAGPSRIEILDRQGEDVGEGTTAMVRGDPRAMRRELGLLPPGQYEVRWTTLSPLDGHTLRGSYFFAVGSRASPDTSVEDGPLDSEGLAGLASRLVALGGLLTWIGMVVQRRVVGLVDVAPARMRMWGRVLPAATALGAASALVASSFSTGAGAAALAPLLTTTSGALRLAQVVVATSAALLGWHSPRRGSASVLLAMVAVAAESASGHAAASPQPVLAVASFAVHLVAVGVWVAAILLSAASGSKVVPTLRILAPTVWRAGVVAGVTGVLSSTVVLSSVSDVVSTAYGRTLAVKVALVAGMAMLGAAHAMRRRSHSRPRTLVRIVRSELLVATGVLTTTGLLVGFASPPAEIDAAGQYAEGDELLGRLVDRDAVSLGSATGSLVVGLTILPPTPGDVELRVQVEGAAADDAVRSVAVRGRGPDGADHTWALQPCGRDCFATEAEIPGDGRWTFDVSFMTGSGPASVRVATPLPAADGRERLDTAIAAMERLETVAVTEELRESTDGRRFISDYEHRAPDSFEWFVRGGSARIAIGDRGFRRSYPHSEWRSFDWARDGYVWPEGYYSTFWRDAAAVRVVGEESVDGAAATVLAFVQPSFPIWYRLWIDNRTDRVLRLEMRTEDHLMEHRYRRFNRPVTIEPPI